jgi:hypothetical protein
MWYVLDYDGWFWRTHKHHRDGGYWTPYKNAATKMTQEVAKKYVGLRDWKSYVKVVKL